jgi:CDGSH-type Zn-finger protein
VAKTLLNNERHFKIMANSEAADKSGNSKCKIKVAKNGPYTVSGSIPLRNGTIIIGKEDCPERWEYGSKYPQQESCSLCRCGESKNKPFCDGMHAKVNFDGTETASHEHYIKRADAIDGPELKLTDLIDLCAIARFCDRAGGVWDLVRHSDDIEARKIAIEEAVDCPAGRLVVWDKKTGKAIEPNFEKSIAFVEDPQKGVSGPIWVRGYIPIESADGRTYEVRNRVTLCRCGRSTNKPFCDGSHIQARFKDGTF